MNPGNLEMKISPGEFMLLEKGKGKTDPKTTPGFQLWQA